MYYKINNYTLYYICEYEIFLRNYGLLGTLKIENGVIWGEDKCLWIRLVFVM